MPHLPPPTFATPKVSAGVTKVIALTKLRTKYKQYEEKPLNMPYSPYPLSPHPPPPPPHTPHRHLYSPGFIREYQGNWPHQAAHQVIGLTKLHEYKQYESKRQLLGSYDLFLADIDIIHQLPPLIGTKFLRRKKHQSSTRSTTPSTSTCLILPSPTLTPPSPSSSPTIFQGLAGVTKDWAKSVREACDSTYLYVSGGPSMSVRAARFGMSEEEIVGNVMAVVAGAVEHVPKKWKNMSSLHIRATDSLALPIYMAEVDLPTKMVVEVVGRKGEEGGGDKEDASLEAVRPRFGRPALIFILSPGSAAIGARDCKTTMAAATPIYGRSIPTGGWGFHCMHGIEVHVAASPSSVPRANVLAVLGTRLNGFISYAYRHFSHQGVEQDGGSGSARVSEVSHAHHSPRGLQVRHIMNSRQRTYELQTSPSKVLSRMEVPVLRVVPALKHED
ncbi:unnamed protein product [Closterium sp. NIES-54]